ncbi:hypothetical protein FSP39_002930 [Pinctada imbricata]|uniref:Forkhead box protein N3 n=1 Tax=Pinctada imbricata TaxID=66713 RepID=A0AA88XU37_PINIB|nr:hypothetical protein FSP39_002930 [Pinctada imbricata]
MVPGSRLEETDASKRERLVNSLSQSFPGSALSRALKCMQPESDDEEDDMKEDFLSSSCFAELSLEKGALDEDDDLTNLGWLQDSNLLKNITCGEDDISDDEGKENGHLSGDGNYTNQTHPPHVPYNPQKHVNSKPPYSFSCLIFMAIEDSPQKKLPVKDIYSWILTHFPYFQHAPTGWKNSVRHNLSLNKCFKKVDKDRGQSIGKGSLWCIDPDYRPNLLQALRKTPYHPYHQLQMLANPQPPRIYAIQNGGPALPLSPRFGPNTISPHLFPFLSRRLAQSNYDIDRDIQDVAHTLVSLKGLGSDASKSPESESERMRLKRKQRQLTASIIKRRHVEKMVFTIYPSEDHTYSVAAINDPGSPGSSIDEEYEFGEDVDEDDDFSDAGSYESWDSELDEIDGDINKKKMTVNPPKPPLKKNGKISKEEEEEEQKKIVEGADALLNLAGIKTTPSSSSSSSPLRTASPTTNTDSGKSSASPSPAKRKSGRRK